MNEMNFPDPNRFDEFYDLDEFGDLDEFDNESDELDMLEEFSDMSEPEERDEFEESEDDDEWGEPDDVGASVVINEQKSKQRNAWVRRHQPRRRDKWSDLED